VTFESLPANVQISQSHFVDEVGVDGREVNFDDGVKNVVSDGDGTRVDVDSDVDDDCGWWTEGCCDVVGEYCDDVGTIASNSKWSNSFPIT
jgi:hypothetical protein